MPASDFPAVARAYCDFIDRAAASSLPERLQNARTNLLVLYSAAILLPPRDAADVPEPANPKPPEDWPSFEKLDLYWEVFDPYVLGEPVAGSLSDDLLDVYLDVGRGLRQWDAGNEAAAIWDWRFSFESHWGDHAVDALRALHRALRRTVKADPRCATPPAPQSPL